MIKNETIKTIETRRSIRKYKDTPITDEELQTILECGKCAPSAMNKQSSLFVVVKSEDILQEIYNITEKYFPFSKPYFYGAKTIVIVFGDSNCHLAIEDGSLALENMFLAAKSLNIGSCWINYLRELFKTKEGQLLQKKMNIDPKYFVVGTAIFGYPEEDPKMKPRKEDYVRIV